MGVSEIDRRRFLQIAGTGVVGTIAFELFNTELYSLYLEHERRRNLPSKVAVTPGSVFFGHAPDQNDINKTFEFQKKLDYPIQTSHLLFTFEHDEIEPIVQKARSLQAYGITPIISGGPGGSDTNGDRQSLSNYLDSKIYFNYLWKLAYSFKKIEKPFYLCPYPEFNGDWYDAYGTKYSTPEQFKDIWKITFDIFQRAGVVNAKFVFTPNSTAYASPFEAYYPEGRVHAFSLRGYNKSTTDRLKFARRLKPNISPVAMFGPDIGTLRRLNPNLPIFIGEYNNAREEGVVDWFRDMFELAEYGVMGLVPYTVNKEGESADEVNWEAIFKRQEVIAVHKQELKKPMFQQYRKNGLFSDNLVLSTV